MAFQKSLSPTRDPNLQPPHSPKLAEEWGFTHLTSSPHYPQSNGNVERAAKTAKDLIIKSEDPYLVLLSYRSTPLENGYNPAEPLMGRKLHSTLPLVPEKLTPKLPNLEHLQKTERAYKLQQAENYNKCHGTSVLPELNPGDKVWVPDKNSPAVVIQKSPQPRSYVVKTEQSLLRRSRRRLIPNPTEIEETAKPLPVANIQPTKEPGSTQGVNTPCSVVKTRSGRTVIPPTQLDF